jgi:hypothetical protein
MTAIIPPIPTRENSTFNFDGSLETRSAIFVRRGLRALRSMARFFAGSLPKLPETEMAPLHERHIEA